MIDRADRLRQQGSQARGRLTVVAGAKGGIGRSTVAINLAASQAVGKGADAAVLADLAVPVGTLGSMLNIEAPDRWAWGEVLASGASAHRLSSYLMHNAQVPFQLLRIIPGAAARDRHPQPSHPARDLEPARQPAAEQDRGAGSAQDGDGRHDPLPPR
jgi:hypothetical protein